MTIDPIGTSQVQPILPPPTQTSALSQLQTDVTDGNLIANAVTNQTTAPVTTTDQTTTTTNATTTAAQTPTTATQNNTQNTQNTATNNHFNSAAAAQQVVAQLQSQALLEQASEAQAQAQALLQQASSLQARATAVGSIVNVTA